MPEPTQEQVSIINFPADEHLAVEAVPGSGKTVYHCLPSKGFLGSGG